MKRLTFAALIVILGACATPNMQSSSRRAQGDRAFAQATGQCSADYADPAIDPIRSKIVIGVGRESFEMLSDESMATAAERPAIRAYAEKAMSCQDRLVAFYREFTTELHVSLYQSVATSANALRAQLHNGESTYAKYNRAMAKLRSEYNSVYQQLNATLAQQNADARFRAEQLVQGQVRNALVLQQTLQQQQQQQLQRSTSSRQHGTINCRRIGESIFCNY
jgi:hypothetical protein